MKAVEASGYGNVDMLELRDREEPALPPKGVKVRVHAASINPIDWKLRRGDLKIVSGKRPPIVPGGDFAGVVAEASPESRYAVGTPVWGHKSALKGGAYADVVAVQDSDLDTLPQNLSFVEAAAFPLAGLTAYQSLVHKGRLKAGQRVMVNGCSGGVGVAAVQIAKALGAHVTGVCSARNTELADTLGCDHVVDYAVTDVAGLTDKVDVWFDAVGTQSFSAVRHQLTERGNYITTLPGMAVIAFGSLVNRFRRQGNHGILITSSTEDLAAMRAMVEAGSLKPIIDRVYPLSEVREATTYSQSGKVVGKVVLKLVDDEAGAG